MAATMLDHRSQYPESPLDPDDTPYPCKGCGEILEEGKAFELAGNRWHIDCFRCNTCNTLLDSDANLLLLGDGSLICNNCTYSCSSCMNKIEDLAILTGDQAFCANCFKCRNCKRKIENLRYARTSQGIFCMDCHEALMARRRKKTSKSTSAKKSANMDKSLPAIPPPEARHTQYVPTAEEPTFQDPMPSVPEAPSISKAMSELRNDTDSDNSRPPTSQSQPQAGGLTLPSTTYRDNRRSFIAGGSNLSLGGEEFLIPLAFDPNPPKAPAPSSQHNTPQVRSSEDRPRDYFGRSGSHTQSASISQSASPQVAQDRNRTGTNDALRKQSEATPSRSGSTSSPFVQPELQPSPHLPQTSRHEPSKSENFKLQEAPKNRKVPSGHSTPRGESGPGLTSQRSPDLRETELRVDDGRTTPRLSYDMSPDFTDGFNSPPSFPTSQSIPKRGDSLMTTKPITRKEINLSSLSQPLTDLSNVTPSKPLPAPVDSAKANGGKVISGPISSPGSQSIYDTPDLPQGDVPVTNEKFVQPRAPPQPPKGHGRNESISTVQSDAQKSPRLPQYSAGGDFTLEEDITRILGLDEPTANESFLRRVSNSVRHGRSYSDRSGRFSRDKWPRSPITAANTTQHHDISSPITSSPENREELAWFKNELRRERQKNAEREKRIAELESQINAAADISQVNVELKEKRSTMVVLDTQKEIVVRELEVMTEHIANAKKGGEPLDMSKLNNAVLRDLAEALEKLKKSFTPQIESLVQQRNELLEEITNLNQAKDKSFHEFEQLSSKNAQLAEFNNQLVDQIQNIYKTNRGPGMEDLAKPNGLGIYSHSKDSSKVSIDGRDIQKATVAPTAPVVDPGATYEAGEAGAIQSVAGAQVVEMKKGAVAKRFDWRRGQKMAKGLTKGVKGAFTSAQQSYGRDMQFAETGAYNDNQIRAGQEYSTLPRNTTEPTRQPGGWFSNTTKPPGSKNGLYASSNNASTPSLLADTPASMPLFGSELEARTEFEKSNIPGIVKRCIAEVEARGMDVEGIYRKSGGNSQVTAVKEGFEREPASFDVSDPDLDIHAVTSGLKQYFRKLPTPLITYDVYDSLIELTKIPEGPNQREERIEGLQNALAELPRVNYEVLEYLMAHLARVVLLEKENLMTPMNVAVVFAPTIMRPESVARELSDTKGKNEVVMWMVQESEKVFGSEPVISRGASVSGPNGA